ncbi:glucosyltransferase domain-containing protein [Paenibacillus sp. NAIST15-1]|uniref:glucosyltransferase domain-containing protein n=1 Tax=Paenibacillus sp. NAIST15-1 TaxID=1605994 RepID=UPI00086A53D8|nr:glucosyltransferase domain-containing protein [Paenibacillus sp. NAIST15-1]GAV12379.1 hypothetical protein PBN151_2312 [Paenibacillus sp. NAIST15-1]
MKWVKSTFSIISEESQAFLQYIRANRALCGIVVFFALIAYGFPLTHFTLSIDEEKSLFSESINSVWVGQGRFGIALIKILFNNTLTNSVTSTFLAVTALSLSGIIWAYVFKSASNVKDKPGFDTPGLILALIFVTFPSFAENIGFSIMSFELGIGWILTAVAVLLIFKWAVMKEGYYHLFFGLLLTTFATSIYQSYLPVFICGVIVCLLLHLISLQKRNEVLSVKLYVNVVVKYIVVTLMSLVLYKVIDSILGIFIPQSGYVSNFIAWGKSDTKEIIIGLLANFKALITGKLIYGSWIMLPSMIVVLCILLLYIYKLIVKKSSNGNMLIITVSLMGIISMPFLMSIILGSPMPIRVNLVLTLFVSFVWYLLFVTIERTVFHKLIVVFILIVSFNQSQSLSQLFYSDYNRYQEDVKLAHQIGYRIIELDVGEAPSQPVVFVGSHVQQQRENIVKQEVLGYSFFEWNGGTPIRMKNFMSSLGYDYNAPTDEQTNRGIEIANEMPAWPNRGSVALVDDIIIVNLSENMGKYSLELSQDENHNSSSQLYSLKLDNPNYYYDMEVSKDVDGHLILNSKGVDPQISFMPENKINNSSFDYIFFEFESNIEGELQVFLAQENESYGEKFNGIVKVKKGINKVYCKRQKFMDNVVAVRIDPPNNSTVKLIDVQFIR